MNYFEGGRRILRGLHSSCFFSSLWIAKIRFARCSQERLIKRCRRLFFTSKFVIENIKIWKINIEFGADSGDISVQLINHLPRRCFAVLPGRQTAEILEGGKSSLNNNVTWYNHWESMSNKSWNLYYKLRTNPSAHFRMGGNLLQTTEQWVLTHVQEEIL